MPLNFCVKPFSSLTTFQAHAMATHLGAGAGQAIEVSKRAESGKSNHSCLTILIKDAYILGRLLTQLNVNKSNLTEVLQVYDAIRRPIAQDVAERSLRLGGVYELDPVVMNEDIDSAKLDAGDRDELQKLIPIFWKISDSVHFTEMPDRDWERAQTMLRNRLGP